MEKIDILSLSLEELENELLSLNEKKFRAKQVFEWLHQRKITDFSQMSNISAQLKREIDQKFYINSLKIKKRLVSAIDNTVKYLYGMSDGEKIETVLMEYKHGNSLCISSQVGCKMKCAFCASAIAGFVRNLTPSEMLLQIYETERDSGRKIDNIVIMGIGEPFDNYDNLIKFLKLLKSGDDMSLRRVSISTCGLVEKINSLAELKLGITLSISLHASNDAQRSKIMPINERYNIESLISSCKNYFDKTGRRISFEFALINGINDDAATANELIKLLKPLQCHVNLIPVNEVSETDFKKSSYVKEFQKMLTENGINATVRRTLGTDINAACGQLRRDNI